MVLGHLSGHLVPSNSGPRLNPFAQVVLPNNKQTLMDEPEAKFSVRELRCLQNKLYSTQAGLIVPGFSTPGSRELRGVGCGPRSGTFDYRLASLFPRGVIEALPHSSAGLTLTILRSTRRTHLLRLHSPFFAVAGASSQLFGGASVADLFLASNVSRS